MKFKKPFFLNIGLAILVSSLVVIFSEQGFLKPVELGALDFLFRLRGPVSYNPNVIIIEIDDQNIAKIGRWPWKRTWHAAITKALKDFGAKYVYFDIVFSEVSFEEDDHLFSEAIKNAGNVYLPFVFQKDSLDLKNALLPLEKFFSFKKSGSINIYPDRDGISRKIPLFFVPPKKTDRLAPTPSNNKDPAEITEEKDLYPHIALKIPMDYLDLKITAVKPGYLLLANSREEIKIPLVEKNKMILNWRGTWKQSFKHYSFLDVLNAYSDSLANKKPNIDIKSFRDSICLVSVTATGLDDLRATPLEPEYPSVGIIATTISNILDKKFITTLPRGTNWLFIYLFGLIPSLLISGEKSLRNMLSVAGFVFFSLLADFSLFKKGLWIDFSLPLLSFFGSYLSVATYNFVRISAEKQGLFKLAITDELTGLYNIRYFKILLGSECLMAKSDPIKKFCVIMGDMDQLKLFNDTYGHPAGDLILKDIANVLKNSVRSSDVAARYGGEEMIVLLRSASLENGLVVAEKIRSNVENHLVKDTNADYKVTISLGVASFSPQDNEESIIKRADTALYKSKSAGRNKVKTVEDLKI